MGTVVSVDVRGDHSRGDFERAVLAVTARLHTIDEMFSPWKPSSWVSRLMHTQARLADCPTDVRRVVEISMSLMEQTEGYFSPYWRGRPSHGRGPDPTALVKGWAAQQASDVLLAHEMPHHVVNAAGDLVIAGDPNPTEASQDVWRVGIGDPHRTGSLVGTIELAATASRWAVATSGPAEQGPHIHDPVTGTLAAAISSATALTAVGSTNEGGATVDACATALVAAGHRAPSLLDRLRRDDVKALVITVGDTIHDPHLLLRRG